MTLEANSPKFVCDKPYVIILVILLLYPLVGIGVDLIAPSLPAIALNLHVSSAVVKNLVAVYLLGYALGSFCLGFLSDAWGRKKIIVCGLLIFTFVSLIPIVLPNIYVLLLIRFLQGFSLAALAVLARSIFSDILSPQQLPRVATLMATMWGVGPIVGPVIGGYLQDYFNWQACFVFYAGFSFCGFIALLWVLPETHLERHALNFPTIKKNFLEIITHRTFLGIILIMGTAYSLLIVFNTLGPFLIQTKLGNTAIYFGHVALFMGVAYLLGTVLCRYLQKTLSAEIILAYGSSLTLLISMVTLSLSYFYSQNIHLITIGSFMTFIGAGILYPAGMGKSMALFRHLAGGAASVMNLVIVSITSLSATLMGFVTANSMVPVAWVYFLLMVLCVSSYLALIHATQKN